MADRKERSERQEAPKAPFSHPLMVQTLSRGRKTTFDLTPAASETADICRFLGLQSLSALRLKGALHPVGETDWRAEGRLTAEAVQSCVVTLAPVHQKIDETVTRHYVPAEDLTELEEISLDTEEDEPDGFEDIIDIGHLLTESLALALEPYPRADDAELPVNRFAPPGVEPLSDEDLKPFAGLAALKNKLSGDKS